jgi:hypothetical protein
MRGAEEFFKGPTEHTGFLDVGGERQGDVSSRPRRAES